MRFYFYTLLLLLFLTLSVGCQEKPAYSGETKNDLPHGTGILIHPNGVTYEGQFQEGKRSGQGTWIHPNGSTYVGEWENDLYHGRGKLTVPNLLTYEGEFYQGIKHGYGTLIWAEDRHYEGTWQNGFQHGEGTMHYADGSHYTGTWMDGSRHGEGTMFYADGSHYEGQWEYDQKHGEGTMYYADGSQYIGTWHDDQLVYIPVQAISLDRSTLSLNLNDAPLILTVSIEPEYATNPEVSWSSSNPAVALVEGGLVIPVQTGSATITAQVEDLEARCEVSVERVIAVTGIIMKPLVLSIQVDDDPVMLYTIIKPENATNQRINWSSSNLQTASVSPQGLVTPLKSGETVIIAETADGGYTASCWIIIY